MADRDIELADKDTDSVAYKVVSGIATMAAAFLARKLLMMAWTKATGKEPPTNPEDPRVALPEALSWAALVGIVIATARVLAIRAVSRKVLGNTNREPAGADD